MSVTYAYNINPKAISVHLLSGKAYTWPSTHSRYEEVKQALREKQPESVLVGLMDEVKCLADKLQSVEDVYVTRDGVFYKDIRIHLSVATRIQDFMGEELDPEPLMRFLGKLLKNPRKESVDSLYDFIEANDIPIYPDGDFLVYKRVRGDYKDIHSGTMANNIGNIVEMHAWQVEADRNRTCDAGLHVCARSYLPHFGNGDGNRVVICKVNPEHVVAVPFDYNNAKMRVHRYEVVGELDSLAVAQALDKHLVVPEGEVDGVTWHDAEDDDDDNNDNSFRGAEDEDDDIY